MIINRLSLLTDDKIIDHQAGFKPGKSTTVQLLNLTQHIEDGFERGVLTGTMFVDLSAAYCCILALSTGPKCLREASLQVRNIVYMCVISSLPLVSFRGLD